MYICATSAAVLVVGFVTDAIGIHALFGALVMGILVPEEGPFASALVEKVEDPVSGLLFSLYFVSRGLKIDVSTIRGLQSWSLLVLVMFTACLGKIAGTIVVSLYCRIPVREALALGFLMNNKGLVELIILNIYKREEDSARDPLQAVSSDQHGKFGSCGDAAAHVLEIQRVQEGPAKVATHVLDNENFQVPEETHQPFSVDCFPYQPVADVVFPKQSTT
ncbi:hypothetical protein PVL29_005021 [Vitis rotundifolia]|uniref:Cation/H+ exchanger transmembrane domain-containing protein n=1 Tax=Vitis rotundifolia TaxID=103349 RepID=A0AA39DZ37_VITRO|nr:hypothetical protein PVL29_005021 [Vitis rotundifolia]